jgi:hypothetical protein
MDSTFVRKNTTFVLATPIEKKNLAPSAITIDLVKVQPNSILLQTFFASML